MFTFGPRCHIRNGWIESNKIHYDPDNIDAGFFIIPDFIYGFRHEEVCITIDVNTTDDFSCRLEAFAPRSSELSEMSLESFAKMCADIIYPYTPELAVKRGYNVLDVDGPVRIRGHSKKVIGFEDGFPAVVSKRKWRG